MVAAASYARRNGSLYLGICLGMQVCGPARKIMDCIIIPAGQMSHKCLSVWWLLPAMHAAMASCTRASAEAGRHMALLAMSFTTDSIQNYSLVLD